MRPHHSQREEAAAEPIRTGPATVTYVQAQDERREEEVAAAVGRLLEHHDRAEWVDAAAIDGASVDWSALWEAMTADGHIPELETAIDKLQSRAERAYPSLVGIRFDPDGELEYVPGEFVSVHFHHVPRAYSVASSPNHDQMEICVRRVPGGRLSTQLCDDLQVGDDIVVRGPYGSEFVLQEPSSRDMVFLATGTGVAPFKSMIDFTFEEGRDEYRGEKRDVFLVLGASWADDLPYREQFRALDRERENFHFVPTLSREHYLTDWDGETAYVQYALMKYLDEEGVDVSNLDDEFARYVGEPVATDVAARLDPANVEVYACGINAMVYSLVDAAERVGVPERFIRSEGYG